MEAARYWLAVATLVTVPPTALGWFIIHPLAAFWRRAGLAVAYSVVLAFVLPGCVALWFAGHWLLSVHYGVSWPLAAAGAALFAASCVIGAARYRQLTPAMTIGVPELSAPGPGKLLTEGIYARIRHPRYVEIGIALAGLALFTNYRAMYALVWLYWPTIYAIVLLEERELRGRFGEAYEEYSRRTPRFIPKL